MRDLWWLRGEAPEDRGLPYHLLSAAGKVRRSSPYWTNAIMTGIGEVVARNLATYSIELLIKELAKRVVEGIDYERGSD